MDQSSICLALTTIIHKSNTMRREYLQNNKEKELMVVGGCAGELSLLNTDNISAAADDLDALCQSP